MKYNPVLPRVYRVAGSHSSATPLGKGLRHITWRSEFKLKVRSSIQRYRSLREDLTELFDATSGIEVAAGSRIKPLRKESLRVRIIDRHRIAAERD